MALGRLTPGSRGRCVRPNDLAALERARPEGRVLRPGAEVSVSQADLDTPEEGEEEEEEEEEDLFKANAVNKEDSELQSKHSEGAEAIQKGVGWTCSGCLSGTENHFLSREGGHLVCVLL